MNDFRRAFEPSNIAEAVELSGQLVRSGLLPKDLTKPEAVLALIMQGRELGLTVMQSVRSLHVLKGKVTISSQGMVAMVLASGKAKYLRLVESTDQVAVYATRRLEDEGETVMRWTIEQARAAGLGSNPLWRSYPAEMLRARCAAALCRERYPDVVAGLYTPEELGSAERQEEPAQEQVALERVMDAVVRVEPEEDERAELIKRLKTAQACLGLDEFRSVVGSKPKTIEEMKVAIERCDAALAAKDQEDVDE